MVNITRADSIPGMTPAALLEFLAGQAQQRRNIVEIGSWRGRSTRALCDNAIGHVWAVDTFEGSEELLGDVAVMTRITGDPDWLYHDFMFNMRDCENLTVVRKPSLEAAAMFEDQFFDMIWIDGSHDYDNVKADIMAWRPKLKPDGFMCGDDYQAEGVKKAYHELVNTPVPAHFTRLWGAQFGVVG
jgi:predicted O-methyltransferase YrrM